MEFIILLAGIILLIPSWTVINTKMGLQPVKYQSYCHRN